MFGGNKEGWGIRQSSRKKPATISPTSKLKLDVHISLFSDVPPSREIGDECKSPEGARSAKEFPSSNANEHPSPKSFTPPAPIIKPQPTGKW